MTMTILPGPGAGEQEWQAPEGGGSRKPQLPKLPGNNAVAIVAIVVVVALLAGGAWWLIRGKSSDKPVAAPVHHVVVHKSHRLPATGKLTRAQMKHTAVAIFSVLPADLPGYVQRYKVSVSQSKPDRQDREIARCSGVRSVVTPEVSSRAFGQNHHFFIANVDYFGSPAAALTNFRQHTTTRSMRCMSQVGARDGMDFGHGTKMVDVTLKWRPLRGIKNAELMQVSGVLQGGNVMTNAVRIDAIVAVVGRTQISIGGFGYGEAVPVSSDVALLRSLIAKAKTRL